MLNKASLSTETLAAVLEQSVDCVKLVDPEGNLLWMNPNGMCAMEIDDFDNVDGLCWQDLWPEPGRALIAEGLEKARAGQTVRFNAHCPTAKGSPRWWDVSISPVCSPDGQATGFLAISRDVTQAETDRAALKIIVAEMRHRLKNSYAIMCSLLMSLARGDRANEAFAQDISKRMIALGAAQSLFDAEDRVTRLPALIDIMIEPFHHQHCPISCSIEDVEIDKANADAIALVVGEMAVNSGKHGALSQGGSISLDARMQDDRLCLVWDEQSLGPVHAQSRDGGQGLNLIAQIVESRNGSFDVVWREQGLTATLTLVS